MVKCSPSRGAAFWGLLMHLMVADMLSDGRLQCTGPPELKGRTGACAGIVPYINASIVLQLLSTSFPYLKKLQREEGPQVLPLLKSI